MGRACWAGPLLSLLGERKLYVKYLGVPAVEEKGIITWTQQKRSMVTIGKVNLSWFGVRLTTTIWGCRHCVTPLELQLIFLRILDWKVQQCTIFEEWPNKQCWWGKRWDICKTFMHTHSYIQSFQKFLSGSEIPVFWNKREHFCFANSMIEVHGVHGVHGLTCFIRKRPPSSGCL